MLAAWWAWVYTMWATNWFDAGTLVMRGILLVGMFAGMVGAISIPDAFGARAWLLVAGYVGIQVVRNLFVVLVTDRDDPLYRPVQRILGWSCAVMPLWIAGALVDGSARVVLWSIALALDYAGPLAGHALPSRYRMGPTARATNSAPPRRRLGCAMTSSLPTAATMIPPTSRTYR